MSTRAVRRPPLDPAIAACRGLSPRERDELITVAKQAAMRWTWAVRAGNAAEVQRLTGKWGRDEFAALAVVLAEGIQPGSYRLLEVSRAPGDGMPGEATG